MGQHSEGEILEPSASRQRQQQAATLKQGENVETSTAGQMKYEDIGIASLSLPAQRGLGRNNNKDSVDNELLSDEEQGASAQVNEQPIMLGPADAIENSKSDTQPYWSRKKLILAGLFVLVLIVAIVVPIAVASGSSDSTPKGITGNNTTEEPISEQTEEPLPGTEAPTPDPEEPLPGTEAPTPNPIDDREGFDPCFNKTTEQCPEFLGSMGPKEGETADFVVPTNITVLDNNLLRYAMISAELCHIVNQINTLEILPTATVFTDEPDKAMVLRLHNVCFGVFRATTPRVDDWLQNLDQRTSDDVCSTLTGECCTAKRGFRRAYNTSFQDDFQSSLEQCKQDCPECEVILTGTSQGAAIAHVAGVFLDHLNPLLLTFGQPYALMGPCPPIDRSRMFRFVNTIVKDENELLYDPVPYLRQGGFEHFGDLFVMGEDLSNVAFYPEGEALDLGLGGIAILNVATAHLLIGYRNRLMQLWFNGTQPIGIGGFGIDHPCLDRTECTFPRICARRQCTQGMPGDQCRDSDECLSGNCTQRACF